MLKLNPHQIAIKLPNQYSILYDSDEQVNNIVQKRWSCLGSNWFQLPYSEGKR